MPGEMDTFYLFFFSVDGMLGKEAILVLITLSQLMTEKLNEPISHICGWVNRRITIAVARSCSRMICGAWFYQSPEGPVSGLVLRIGPWFGEINCAPQSFHAHTHTNVFTANVTTPASLIHILRACNHWLQNGDSLWGPDNICYWHSGRQKKDIGFKISDFRI